MALIKMFFKLLVLPLIAAVMQMPHRLKKHLMME